MQILTTFIESTLNEQFPGALLQIEEQYDFPVFIIANDQVKNVLKFLKENKDTDFHFLTTLCCIHYNLNTADKEFAMMYQLHNMPKGWRIRIKTFLPKDELTVPTVTDLWPAANWLERQEFDFFGIFFDGHPNLKRILNMDEMNYHPMRKEYALEDFGRTDKDDKMFGR
ncbi:MAG TPA: NADH-quinone oxidoreductase subunit C [Chitinophagales bacterium]|nr:NADH-quinone oxidoreductase subunit C [Chitinophagales bacterium]